MRKLCFILALMVMACSFSADAKKKEEPAPEYQIEGVGATGGNSIVKVIIITKKPDKVTENMLARSAVHGVLFRGYTKVGGMGGGSQTPAMTGSPTKEIEHSQFFEPFFANNTYAGYVQLMGDSRRVSKVGKEYKVSCEVLVSEGQLRKDLISAGIVKDMQSGW